MTNVISFRLTSFVLVLWHRALSATLLLFVLLVPAFAQDSVGELARILRDKGVITNSDLEKLESTPSEERVHLLASLLETKGVLTPTEVASFTRNSAIDGQNATARLTPAAYGTSPPAAVVEPQAPAKGPETQSAPVTSQSKVPVAIYGTILLNAFFDTSLNNIEDIPLLASKKGSDPFPDDKTFGMTARQSRLGLRYQGPNVGGAKISGQVEVDFLGGKAAFSNGINMDLLRLRLALGRLDWTNFSFVAGQDWSIFAPLNPTSFASYAIPAMSASGNPWDPNTPDPRGVPPRPGRYDENAMADCGNGSRCWGLSDHPVPLGTQPRNRRARPHAGFRYTSEFRQYDQRPRFCYWNKLPLRTGEIGGNNRCVERRSAS